MDCKEFRELFAQDRDLSEPGHLVECSQCHAEFGHGPLHQRIKTAGRAAEQFRMRGNFGDSLASKLRSEFFAEESKRSRPSFKILVPVFTLLLLVGGLGLLSLQRSDLFVSTGAISDKLSEIGHIVAGNHVYCALDKAGFWDTVSKTDYPEKAKYQQAVIAPLRSGYSESVSLVSVHMCTFEGVPFKHIVLRDGQTLVSVFVLEINEHAQPRENPIVTKFDNGFQMASFDGHGGIVFVVSDLPETKNLTIARALSYTMNEISHLAVN